MNKQSLAIKAAVCLAVTGIMLLAACSPAHAPEASKPIARAAINRGDIVPASQIRTAEYLQYYDQHFPEPGKDAVGLDLRLGNNNIPAQGGTSWLQIGLQTKSAESTFVAPLNLAIVIDASGSMVDSDKMPFLKQSLAIFLRSLNSRDIISIVVYSTDAKVLLPAQPLGDGRWIQSVIDRIKPEGTTNLHAGMMLGFKEVDKNFDIRKNNRVILLTDGIANAGVTDPAAIAADALSYNQKGITLSTIGLGKDFNDLLLITLSKQGKAGYAFIDTAAEMDRVFREQATSMKQEVADNVVVRVIPGEGVRLTGITGMDGVPPAGGASINLWPMGLEDSKVILARLEVGPGWDGQRRLATVQVSYLDISSQRTVTLEKDISAQMSSRLASYDPTWDLEILRNVTIQNTAEGMKKISQMFDAGQYEAAWRTAVDLDRQLTEVARLTGDKQLSDDAVLMRKYQGTLSDAVWQMEGRRPVMPAAQPPYTEGRPYRGETQPPPLPNVNIN